MYNYIHTTILQIGCCILYAVRSRREPFYMKPDLTTKWHLGTKLSDLSAQAIPGYIYCCLWLIFIRAT